MRYLRFRHSSPDAMRGMSLVEILVAAVIGLIGITVIMQVFSVAEGQKRTTTGTSDAQISGNLALFGLERDLRYAGFNLVTNSANMLGCLTHVYDRTRPAGSLDFTVTMAPVIIAPGGAGTPDRITVVYGNSATVIEPTRFGTTAGSGTDFPTRNAAGYLVGNLVAAFEAGKDCSIAEITGFAGNVNTIKHENGASYSYTDSTGAVVNNTEKYNKSGGLGIAYTDAAYLFALGRSPVVRTYSISNDRLVTETLLPYVPAQDVDGDGDSDAQIAPGIVQLKAQYGKDTNGDRIVDTWDTTTPTTAAGWLQVRAVRVGVLARSGQYEKTAVTGTAPSWYGGAFTMTNPADGTDWHNYRYRVYQTVVPLRNMIWSTDP
jgi:type IV pilus assembly protein PilW